MEQVDGRLYCVPGGMDLAPAMQAQLEQIAASEPSVPDLSSTRWGGEWHCPADGSRMAEEAGRVGCPTCGRYLPPAALYGLIEHHQHNKPKRRLFGR
jgi:hypothetical protein